MPWPRFHARANNCNITYLIFWQESNLSNQTRKKKRCYGHYLQRSHNGICDWEILVTHTAKMDRFLRQKELYWYNKLKTFTGFGLDKNHVYMMQHIRKRWSFYCSDIISIIILFFSVSFLFGVIMPFIVNSACFHKLYYWIILHYLNFECYIGPIFSIVSFYLYKWVFFIVIIISIIVAIVILSISITIIVIIIVIIVINIIIVFIIWGKVNVCFIRATSFTPCLSNLII